MRNLLEMSGWGKKKTILVVDDDPDLRLGMEIRLKANGYHVVLASDGAGSLVAAEKHRPDLILLDLGLPAGDGYHVMKELQKSSKMNLIPVIVLSARESKPNRDWSIQGGAYRFLQKPVETADVLLAIGHALGQGKGLSPTPAERERLQAESESKMLNRILS